MSTGGPGTWAGWVTFASMRLHALTVRWDEARLGGP
jgi:hypothetical protein